MSYDIKSYMLFLFSKEERELEEIDNEMMKKYEIEYYKNMRFVM